MTPAATKKLIERTLAAKGIVTTGAIFYVDSTSASKSDTDAGGLDSTAPFATLDYAIGKCVASRGDVVILMPGHVETVTAAAGVALDVIGVSVVGIGTGHLAGKIQYTTAAGASFDISAASCRVTGLWFNSAIADQTSLINVSAADVKIDGNELMIGDGTVDAEAGITVTAAGDRVRIEGNHIYSTAANAITAGAITCGAADNSVIRGNIIYGYFGTAGAVVNSAAAVGFHTLENFIVNRTADGNNKAIVYHASTVGMIARNSGSIIDSTSPAPVTAAAAFVAGNYFSSAAGVTASALM